MSAYLSFTLDAVQNQDRRKFLKQTINAGFGLGAGVAGASFLGGCSSFDRVILGGAPRDPNQVVILGGGLAGLTTAYLCKKNGIPFVLYEGSSRFGGRVLTLREFNLASQAGDLGGEWISRQHELVLKLAKELSVDVAESPFRDNELLYFDGAKSQDRQKLQAEYKSVQKKSVELYVQIFRNQANQLSSSNRQNFSAAVDQDKINCEELIQKLTLHKSQLLPVLMRRQIQLNFGAEAEQVSSLSWLKQMMDQNEFSILTNSPQFRISGGSSVLTQALYERVAGVIPGRFVNLSHKLVSVAQDSAGFELRFETPQGVKTVQTKKVISTLPLSILRQIKGISQLSFKDEAHQAIAGMKAGDQAKGVLSFTERPWKRLLGARRFSGSWGSQNFWESEPRSAKWQQSTDFSQRSVLTFQLGGTVAAQAGLHSIDSAIQDLASVKLASGYENISQIQNWTLSPWFRGGRSYFAPGQNAIFAGALLEPQLESQRDSQWLFAGEAASLQWPGTMNGAIDSAQNAYRILFNSLTKIDSQKRS